MKQTEAIVFTGVGQVEVRRVDVPEPGPHEVQVRTLFSTISGGTEGWILENLFTWKTTDYPCVPGYQRMGVIEAVGAEVTGWQPGERVMATVSSYPGINAQSGSHSALSNTSAAEIYRIPDGTDDVDASGAVVAQVQPGSVAGRAASKAAWRSSTAAAACLPASTPGWS